jgi:PatG C-terminal
MNIPQLTARQVLGPATVTYQGEPASSFSLSGAAATIHPACGGGAKPACSCSGSGGGGCSCGGAAAAPPVYVYAIGAINPVFPSLSVEKEFLQAMEPPIPPVDTRTIPVPLSDAWYFQVLGKASNLYIAREMCWQFRRDATTSYLLIPRSQDELVGMVSASAPSPKDTVDFDVVLGRVGPTAPQEMCNGLILPTIICDETFNFSSKQYMQDISAVLRQGTAISPPVTTVDDKLLSVTFAAVMRMSDNMGDTNAFRAMNFLVVRYLDLYVLFYNMAINNFYTKANPSETRYLITAIKTQPAPIQGSQTIIDVIFSFVGQTTNTLFRWSCRVDVSGEFPFLVFPLAPYYGT